MKTLNENIQLYTFNQISSKNIPKVLYFENYEIDLHKHDFVELNIIQNGEGIHYIDNNEFLVKKGDVFVVPIHVSHGYKNIKNLNVIHIIFPEYFFTKYEDIFLFNMEFLLLFSLEPNLKNIYGLNSFLNLNASELVIVQTWVNDIYKFQTGCFSEQTIICESLSILILSYFFKIYREKCLVKLPLEINSMANVISEIYKSYNSIQIDKLVKLSGFSRTNFFKFFKKILNTTPSIFINKCRISMAIKFLKNLDLSLSEVAQKCGFYDSSHFIKYFKKYTNITPYKYRKNHSKI